MAIRIMAMIMPGTIMGSKRDWHCEVIELNTIIDENYKNTQNVRRFFKFHIGDHFKFDRSFMKWMTHHKGSNMQEAIAEWQKRHGHDHD